MLIETAFRLGCRFDGWSDRFRFDLWEEALRRTGIDAGGISAGTSPFGDLPLGADRLRRPPGFSAGRGRKGRRRRSDAGLPDRIVQRLRRLRSHETDPGRVTAPADAPVGTLVSTFAGPEDAGGPERAFRLRFTKLGPARFLSHLELSTALSRAMILGGIFFVYSQGFHPHPRISFAGATAVGMESRGEFADIRIQDPGVELKTLVARINAGLPSGVAVTAMRELPPHDFSLAEMVKGFSYDIILPEEIGEEDLHEVRSRHPPFSRREEFPRPPGSEREDGHQGDSPPRHGPRPGPAFPPDHSFRPFRSGGDGPPHRTL